MTYEGGRWRLNQGCRYCWWYEQVLFPGRSSMEKEMLASVVSELPSLAKEQLNSTRSVGRHGESEGERGG